MSNYPEQVVNKDGKTTTLIKIVDKKHLYSRFQRYEYIKAVFFI